MGALLILLAVAAAGVASAVRGLPDRLLFATGLGVGDGPLAEGVDHAVRFRELFMQR